MPLIDLWNNSPEELEDKQINQLIGIAGSGKLLDGSSCSTELRELLANVHSQHLSKYAEQCLIQSFTDSGLALQDVVNEIGARLGADVTHGRYRGNSNNIGFDGLWKFDSGHAIVVEVKTTDTFRIDLNTIARYRDALIDSKSIEETKSSILLIVGRQDTGDLEAQIRGSRFAWDIRIISVYALLRLMSIKEEMEDPQIIQRIHNILIPQEFTRLDYIAEILFSATEDVKQETITHTADDMPDDIIIQSPKPAPASFHEACIVEIQLTLSQKLVKRTRALYSTSDKSLMVNCAVSKEYDSDKKPNYWFAFHKHQRLLLQDAHIAYVAFGCGSSDRILLIPFNIFDTWLEKMWTTQRENGYYWHVVIFKNGEKYSLHRKKGEKNIDLTSYLIHKDNKK